MGLPIGKILKGVIGLVVGKTAKKAGMDKGTSKSFIDIADDLIDNDQEIASAIQDFIVSFEGKYSELKTKAEGIVRTFTRPLLTIGVVTNIIVMIWKGIVIPQILGWMGVILVSSWCSTKAFRDWKKAKPPK